MTPLHLACIYGHADIVQLLVQAGCSIRCKDDDSSTPLHMAAAEGNLEVYIGLRILRYYPCSLFLSFHTDFNFSYHMYADCEATYRALYVIR